MAAEWVGPHAICAIRSTDLGTCTAPKRQQLPGSTSCVWERGSSVLAESEERWASWPNSSLPQLKRTPSCESAKLTAPAQLTARTRAPSGSSTCCGSPSLSSKSPKPSCPSSAAPHAYSAPLSATARQCASPHEICTTFTPLPMRIGSGASLLPSHCSSSYSAVRRKSDCSVTATCTTGSDSTFSSLGRRERAKESSMSCVGLLLQQKTPPAADSATLAKREPASCTTSTPSSGSSSCQCGAATPPPIPLSGLVSHW
mmetsp:Transcript_16199/g.38891  ORF Transcript_16199/g.38891 Transcript_16199/m.38891 type:complete len:257 (-) Transcript_16199:577-1347(-)